MARMEEPKVAAPARVEVARRNLDFDAFFQEHSEPLFRALRLLTGNAHEAEELTQESFLKVWQRWDRVRTMEDPVGYLFRVGMNGYRTGLRRLRRLTGRKMEHASPEDPSETVEARDAFRRWLDGLTPRQREAVILTRLVGLDTETAARTLRVKSGTVHVLLSQARSSLRRMTENDDG